MQTTMFCLKYLLVKKCLHCRPYSFSYVLFTCLLMVKDFKLLFLDIACIFFPNTYVTYYTIVMRVITDKFSTYLKYRFYNEKKKLLTVKNF